MSHAHTAQIVLASVFAAALMGCGSSSPEATASETATATDSPSAAKRLQDRALPSGDCPMLSEPALRRHFPNAPAEILTRTGSGSYPSCTFRWVTTTTDTRTMAGRVVEFPGEGRVTVTVAPVRAPEADWQRVLSSYRTEPPVAVDGIGDKAVWSDQRNQLSVLIPRWVVHVAVEDDDTPGVDREQAVAVARDILEDLR